VVYRQLPGSPFLSFRFKEEAMKHCGRAIR
jgi:hypothetical protein